MSLAYTCNFILHRRKKEDQYPHLTCRVFWASCTLHVSLNLGFLVDPERWDREFQLCKPRSFHGPDKIPAATINAEIGRYKDAVASVFGSYLEGASWPSAEAVRRDLRVALGLEAKTVPPTEACYRQFYREASVSGSWKEGTRKKMRTVGKRLCGYEPFQTMAGFTKANLTAYVEKLRDEGFVDSTMKKEVGYLRWFLKWADEQGLLTDPGWKTFRPKMRETARPVVFLTWDELMRVWKFEGGSQTLQDVADMFLFSCFTSLRWSDVEALRWSDVSDKAVSVVTVKTSDPLVIDLNKWSQEILSRMVDRGLPDDRVFPRIPNQIVNRTLKTIGKACELEDPVTVTTWKGSKRTDVTKTKAEMLTFHAGRRTFICQALMMGIPPTTVMKWTGHSDYTAMRPYIGVADAEKAREMAKFDEKR